MMQVMKHKKASLAVAAALALGSASAVHAEIGLKAGAWDLSFSGNVNGFATWNSCDSSATVVAGGLACNNGVGGGKEQAIESGLLPSALVFGAKSRQAGWDIGWTLGFYPGITSSATGKHGIGASTIDMRQNFLTFGDKTVGTDGLVAEREEVLPHVDRGGPDAVLARGGTGNPRVKAE